jgi:hypothetical protein
MRLATVCWPAAASATPAPGCGTLAAIGPVVDQTRCPFASAAALTAARARHPSEPLARYLDRSVPDVISFAERAAADHLDALVYRFAAAEAGRTLPALGRLALALVTTLMAADPRGAQELDRDRVLAPDWRLSFAGADFFMPVFAPLYPVRHSRHAPPALGQVFVLLQPNASFHRKLGSRGKQVRASIRHRFAAAGQHYDSGLLEAHKFVLPLRAGDPPVRWYDMADGIARTGGAAYGQGSSRQPERDQAGGGAADLR